MLQQLLLLVVEVVAARTAVDKCDPGSNSSSSGSSSSSSMTGSFSHNVRRLLHHAYFTMPTSPCLKTPLQYHAQNLFGSAEDVQQCMLHEAQPGRPTSSTSSSTCLCSYMPPAPAPLPLPSTMMPTQASTSTQHHQPTSHLAAMVYSLSRLTAAAAKFLRRML
jgi:hypothetical protein